LTLTKNSVQYIDRSSLMRSCYQGGWNKKIAFTTGKIFLLGDSWQRYESH
jgi:hypothetical protein